MSDKLKLARKFRGVSTHVVGTNKNFLTREKIIRYRNIMFWRNSIKYHNLNQKFWTKSFEIENALIRLINRHKLSNLETCQNEIESPDDLL